MSSGSENSLDITDFESSGSEYRPEDENYALEEKVSVLRNIFSLTVLRLSL